MQETDPTRVMLPNTRLHRFATLLLALCASTATCAQTEDEAETEAKPPPAEVEAAHPFQPPDALSLDATFYTALPLALDTGQTLGGAFTATWRPSALGGFDFGGRIRLGRATEYDRFWEVEHDELLITALAGWSGRVGESVELFAALGVGVDLIFEERFRHQGERLGDLEDTETTQSGLAPTFYADITAGARLFFYDGWGMTLGGGPALGVLDLGGEVQARLGWSAMIGVVWQLQQGGL